MEFVVCLVSGLVFGVVVMFAQLVRDRYVLKRRHMDSLGRLDEVVRVSLPPIAGELVSAAIDEELSGV
jgi:hypothetical protein